MLRRLTKPKLVQSTQGLTLVWPDRKSFFHYCWLRDNCQSPISVHPSNRQKLHSSGQVPPDVQPIKVDFIEDKLAITWPNGCMGIDGEHQSEFELDWLRRFDYSNETPPLYRPVTWDAQKYQKRYRAIDFTVFMNTDDGLMKALMDLRDYGLCFFRNVPVGQISQVEALAQRFGPIRNTFYGSSWDVKSVQNPKNIAYTSLFLGLHMDLM